MTQITDLQQAGLSEIERSTQWVPLNEILTLLAEENQLSRQRVSSILSAGCLAKIRPILHDDRPILSNKETAVEDCIECALTPASQRKQAFDAETIYRSDEKCILWTIPSITDWLKQSLPELHIPVDWQIWMTESYPALLQANQIINSSDSGSTDDVSLNDYQIIRLNDAPSYLKVSRNRFNKEARKDLRELRIGERGIGFFRSDLDSWLRQEIASPTFKPQAPYSKSKNPNGLFLRGSTWHIDKVIGKKRICQSTGTRDLADAERVLAMLISETYEAQSFGTRPSRSFATAANYYLQTNSQKKSIGDDKRHLDRLLNDNTLAETNIDKLHRGLFDDFVEQRQKEGVTTATINHALKVVRQLLNQAANDWRDDYGLTWLEIAPKIKLLPDKDKRSPRVMTWPEQLNLFALLPVHLRVMAEFAVNTGCRESEVCNLSWQWERKVLDSSVFVLPKDNAKNGRSRVIVPNQLARECIESQRGKHPERVFTFRGKPVEKMNNSGWKTACKAAGMYNPKTGLRVHDLRHTAATRLRHAGVDEETRREILGHSSGRSMTNHYSAASLRHLMESVELLCPKADGSLLFDDIVLRL